MSQPPDDHLKALWQGQETETKPMSVAAIRQRAARYTLRRRWSYLFGFALMAFEIVVFGRFALILPTQGARLGMLAILVGLGWAIARFSLGWPGRFPDASASGGAILDFHRQELQRQRVRFRDMMVTVGPLIAALVFAVVAAMLDNPHPRVMNAAPVLGLLAIWFVCAWWISGRAERKRLRMLAQVEDTRPE